MENQFIFTNPLKHFEIEDKGKKRFFIKGDFSNTEKDLVNDICTPNCIKSMVNQLKSRSVKLDFEHDTLRGSSNLDKEANKTILPLGKAIDADVKDGDIAEATWELNEDYKKFDGKGNVVLNIKDIKSNIKSGMLDAFSIGYIPTKTHMDTKDGEQVRMLDDVKIITIALTGSPINTTSQVRSVFVKSMTAFEEFEKERKSNPDIEDLIEIKTSPKERRTQARNEAVSEGSEGDEDEDEEETKRYGSSGKPKKQKKTYEKDGAHAHTENEPLGLHNHPEIEEKIRLEISFLHNRINSLTENESEKPILDVKSKSSHKGNTNSVIKEEKKNRMEEKNESNESAPESAKVESSAESGESHEENSKPLEEIKALLVEQTKRMDSFEKNMKSLSEVKSKEVKSNSKVLQENVDVKNIASEVKAIGGLSELQ